MSRALLTLLAGIVLAVLFTAGIAGDRDLLPVLGPVLVTTALGTAVLVVVAGRARIRDRAERLDDRDWMPATAPDVTDDDTSPATAPDTTPASAPDEEADRG